MALETEKALWFVRLTGTVVLLSLITACGRSGPAAEHICIGTTKREIDRLEELAWAGNRMAQYGLGLVYLEMPASRFRAPDDEKAKFWLGQAVVNGSGAASGVLEGLVETGKIDVGWALLSAKQGFDPCARLIGDCYRRGIVFETNQVLALSWYLVGVRLGGEPLRGRTGEEMARLDSLTREKVDRKCEEILGRIRNGDWRREVNTSEVLRTLSVPIVEW